MDTAGFSRTNAPHSDNDELLSESTSRDALQNICVRLQSLEDKTVKLTAIVKELSDMMKKYSKTSFVIKGSPLRGIIIIINFAEKL